MGLRLSSRCAPACPVLPLAGGPSVRATQRRDGDACASAPSASGGAVTHSAGLLSRGFLLCFSPGVPRALWEAGSGPAWCVWVRFTPLRDFVSSSLIVVRLLVLMALLRRFAFLVALQIPPLLLSSGCCGRSVSLLVVVGQPSSPVGETWSHPLSLAAHPGRGLVLRGRTLRRGLSLLVRWDVWGLVVAVTAGSEGSWQPGEGVLHVAMAHEQQPVPSLG